MSAHELYEAALAQPVIYYRPVRLTQPSQGNTWAIEDVDEVEGGNTTVVEDNRAYELEEELAILSTLDSRDTGYKGSGKWQRKRETESLRHVLTVAYDGSFIGGAPATVTNTLKEVMRNPHTGYPEFTKDERVQDVSEMLLVGQKR